MIESFDLRMTRIPLNHGAGHMPALGFGTLIPDAAVTITATRDALEAGFRHFDCAERYGNERLQSPARTRRTGFRSESRQTWAQVSGSLSHSHSICISTRGRPGSAGSKRQCHLRPRRNFAGHLESDGKSRGSRQVPGHRTFRHRFKRSEAHL